MATFKKGNKIGKGGAKPRAGRIAAVDKAALVAWLTQPVRMGGGTRDTLQNEARRVLILCLQAKDDLGHPSNVAFQAAKLITEYRFGKPTQAIEVGGDEDGAPIQVEVVWKNRPPPPRLE